MDCIEALRVLEDKSVDLLLTDPPYGIDIAKTGTLSVQGASKKTRQFEPGTWDKRPSKEYFDEMIRVSKNQIIFGGNYFTDYLRPSSCWLVWYKKAGLPGKMFADAELIWTSFTGWTKVFAYRQHGFIRDSDDKRCEHPNQKPEALLKWIIMNYSKEGDVILDPFLGSGTTAAVAKMTHRHYIGVDNNQAYVDMAKERVGKAVVVNNKWLL
jgi:site-specific DNA-methyltransferase (adenine-specific)